MTDKTKALAIMILTAILFGVLILSGCRPFVPTLTGDRCDYQIIPAPLEIYVPVMDVEPEAPQQPAQTKGQILCQL